mmetsp:Transcript_29033/g.63555  ORF Transcript_29033/g.63555 Transcript_29033/m.63555 type:complete len:202 (-) Transcript_29033:4342-4947(-)
MVLRESSLSLSAQMSLRESIGARRCRAVCWRNAVRKAAGCSSSCSLSGARSSVPERAASYHCSSATSRAAACFIHCTGASGPSQMAVQAAGTSPLMSALPCARVDAPSSSVPRTTRPMALSDSSTTLRSVFPLATSMFTNTSTGVVSDDGGAGEMLRTPWHDAESFCHRLSIGESWLAHRSRSKVPADCWSVPIARKLDWT